MGWDVEWELVKIGNIMSDFVVYEGFSLMVLSNAK